jgi:hypothetical protein
VSPAADIIIVRNTNLGAPDSAALEAGERQPGVRLTAHLNDAVEAAITLRNDGHMEYLDESFEQIVQQTF